MYLYFSISNGFLSKWSVCVDVIDLLETVPVILSEILIVIKSLVVPVIIWIDLFEVVLNKSDVAFLGYQEDLAIKFLLIFLPIFLINDKNSRRSTYTR